MSYARMVQLDEECKHLQIMANNNISGSRLFNARLCGAIWRAGDAPHEDGSPNTQGHWVAASHIPSTRDWEDREWYFKDGMQKKAGKETTERILQRLDEVEKSMNEFYLVIDLKDM